MAMLETHAHTHTKPQMFALSQLSDNVLANMRQKHETLLKTLFRTIIELLFINYYYHYYSHHFLNMFKAS